ncbi:MAG: hypothetical protein A3C36_00130 [Omnitrophica WOR_2 bacterium RIFCSPHIGHO2_02_FULL_52_10]|nr:MAG: hypothetical protein A3C36_00130 [Omnitrophica WOR_2 bacterium RIFCSPHIGHO2_02_FULL_52_10]
MSQYHCLIITPAGKVFADKIDALSATGATGSFGVWGHHAPMVIAMTSGPMTIRLGGQEVFYAVSSGVLEVTGNSDVILLADSAVKTNSYAEAKAAARQ